MMRGDLSATCSSGLCVGVLFVALTLILNKEVRAESNSTSPSLRCHWCGPRAEQVHRSRRASVCDPNSLHTQVTECDTGYNYCAIVVTTPPYTESRLCVKLYQDECYPLYCNTTDTWRITCPCKGDLCNGANTEREINAFSALSKLAYRNTTPSTRRKTTKKHTNIVKRQVDGDSATNDHTSATLSSENQIPEDKTLKSANNVEMNENKKLDDENETKEKSVETVSGIYSSPLPKITLIEETNLSSKSDKISPTSTVEPKSTELLPNDNQKSSIMNHIETEITKTWVKPSVSLPTAEAFKHDVSPTTIGNVDKTTESTILETKTLKSANNVEMSENKKLDDENETKEKSVETVSGIYSSPLPKITLIEETNLSSKSDKISATSTVETKTTELLPNDNQKSGIMNHIETEITKTWVKPSVSLPTAEAFKHNVSPTTIGNVDKTTESTILETISTTTTILNNETILLPHKNGISNSLANKGLFIIITLLILLNIV